MAWLWPGTTVVTDGLKEYESLTRMGYQHRVEGKHLQGYLNGFCFRFNRRDNLVAAFQTILSLVPKAISGGLLSVFGAGLGPRFRPGSAIP